MMLYKVISDWVTEKITQLNNNLAAQERLTANTVNFDMDFLPANLKDNSFLIKLSEVSFPENESGEIIVNVKIEFHFRLYKKSPENYKKIIDDKLFALCKLLSDDPQAGLEYVSDGFTIANIHRINISGTDKAFKGGEFIFPVVGFELQVFNNEQ
ncbi:MAG TPA: hypothetical protein VG961_03225 [Ignavibacteria bacterium]|nr:hypothetical protein [Ignavibacteria bacterium]